MLTVHHLGISQSERIVWLCEELGIPYELKVYDRDPATGGMAPANYKALHPLGTAPIITDGVLTLAESGAIMDYIMHKYGGGRLAVSPDRPNYADYSFWYHFANGSMMPAIMFDTLIPMMGVDPSNQIAQALQARAKIAFDMVEARLSKAPYFAGDDFTAADIINVFPFTTMRAFFNRDLSAYPSLLAYLKRIGARPAYQRAMAKGDPGLTPLLS